MTSGSSNEAASARVLRPRLDLGFSRLRPEWKALFARRHLREDAIAAASVAAVAIPLSLAIAVASEVPPALGLISAVVGAIVVALSNGTPLAVSGPAAAMAVLVGTVVEAHGLGGLLFAGFVAGVLQLLTGALGLGRLVRLVPSTVVHGFTAGIGAIILLQQFPRALGFSAPDESHVLDAVFRLGYYVSNADPRSVAIAGLVIAIAVAAPRISKKLPGILLAVIVPTILAGALGWELATIGALPSTLPAPSFPSFESASIIPLLGDALVIYLVASLETLLSSAAVDKMVQGQRHDPDQELIGQGIGNMAVSALGGIVVTGVIARSALNVQTGAKTRRAALLSGVGVLAALFFLGGAMSRIPMAALAGVLLVVGGRMISFSAFVHLARVSRTDAAVF
ncbi:MAG: SulP family inorganic anion transporter, partial [Polyangiaceae bacterium]|nr:SulP family inorganic anion transporter [Polyangiaceae bacterium]